MNEKISSTKNIIGVIGDFVDQETVWMFRRCLNIHGADDIRLQDLKNKINYNLDLDLRTNYLFPLDRLTDVDLILLVGTNPRYEASTLNVKLKRQVSLHRDIKIANIGVPLNLTYPSVHVGNDVNSLLGLARGRDIHIYLLLFKASNPVSILGNSNLVGTNDGKGIQNLFNIIFSYSNRARVARIAVQGRHRSQHCIAKKICTLYSQNSKRGTSFVLNSKASIPGALDLGTTNFDPLQSSLCNSHLKRPSCNSLLYLVGADFSELDNCRPKNSVIIYQGHHGDYGAKNADIILPAASYAEKKGSYANIEGRVQNTEKAMHLNFDLRDD